MRSASDYSLPNIASKFFVLCDICYRFSTVIFYQFMMRWHLHFRCFATFLCMFASYLSSSSSIVSWATPVLSFSLFHHLFSTTFVLIMSSLIHYIENIVIHRTFCRLKLFGIHCIMIIPCISSLHICIIALLDVWEKFSLSTSCFNLLEGFLKTSFLASFVLVDFSISFFICFQMFSR